MSGNLEQLLEIAILLSILFDRPVIEHKTARDCNQSRTIESPICRIQVPAADQTEAPFRSLSNLDIEETNIVKQGPRRKCLNWKLWSRHGVKIGTLAPGVEICGRTPLLPRLKSAYLILSIYAYRRVPRDSPAS